MATKTINSRIQLKYDTLENWNRSNVILLAGEMAVASISTPTAGEFDSNVTPTVGIKIGDGTKTFSQLAWAQGTARDVYAWAKAATKPTYSANEITGLSEYVEGLSIDYIVEADANNGHTFYLKSKGPDDADYSTVSTITIPDNDTTYGFAEGSVNGAIQVTPAGGSAQSVPVHGLGTAAYAATTDFDAAGAADDVLGTAQDAAGTATVYGVKNLVGAIPNGSSATTVVGYVDEQIADAIDIDVPDTAVAGQVVSAVSQADGAISVTRRALVAADIPGLDASKITSGTLGVANGGTGASTLASGEVLVGNGTGTVQTKAIDSAVTSASDNLITSGAVYTAIDQATAGLSGAMHLIGTATVAITNGSTADPVISGYNFANKQDGDVVLYSGLEFVWDGTQWVQLGDESSYALKTVSVSAGSGLTGGGNLTENRTISHAVPIGAGTSNDVTAASGTFINAIAFDDYGHVTSVGTGSATTYAFAEGSVDGNFEVTPAGGNAINVPIHGLGSAAYADVAAAIDATTNANKLATASLVKGYADGLIAGLDSSVSATAASGDVYSVLTGVTEVDGMLTSKTEVTLAAIAKTGNVNDLIQTSGDELILNCGSATVNV